MKDINSAPVKIQEITVQVPECQARVLRQYCLIHGLTVDTVVIAALCAVIEGFESGK